MTALNRIADLTNDGMEPNEAIIKVASTSQIPAGHIQLLVNAYNTGRTTAQRRSSDDVWSKVAEFPLADAAIILERMFPDRIKTAAEEMQENVVSYEYGIAPGWVERMKAAEARSRKVDWKMVEPPEPYPTEKDEYKLAQADINRFKVRAEEARYKAAAAFTYAVQAKDKLADHFKVAGCIPFQEVRANAELLYGASGKALFDQLAQEYPKFVKQAARSKISAARGPVYDTLSDCMELTEAYTVLKDDYQTKQAESQEKKVGFLGGIGKGFRTGKGLTYNFGNPSTTFDPAIGRAKANEPPAPPPPYSSGPGSLLQAPQMLGRGFGGMRDPGSWMNRWKADEERNILTDKTKEQFKSRFEPSPDWGLEGQIDALHQNATLNELMSGDETLTHRNPHEVLDAFSHLRRFAPHLANDREMLRTYLRKKLEGGMGDVFEQKTLAETEKLMRDIAPKSELDGKKEEKDKDKDKK